MANYGVRVQRGYVAESPEEAVEKSKQLLSEGASELVIKSQIHAGGRGKGVFRETGFKGGVKITSDPNKVGEFAKEMLGNHLITKQTPPEGQKVRKVLVHEGLQFGGADEKYFAIVMDRNTKGPALLVSPQGGVDIEEVAESNPNAIKKIPINFTEGITDAQAVEAASFLGFDADQSLLADGAEQIKGLYKLFAAVDATQVEINPLVKASNGKIYCIDSKINFDDNAAFRQKAIFAQRDTSMEDPRDVQASEYGLNYVGLDGNIGCLVNGAGLAMATLDVIKLHGGNAANFLDVGGGATAQMVEQAFKLITSDPKVKAIMVNIFGGIMKCDVIAEGIVTAAKNLDLKIPLIVRLEGTNVTRGLELLKESGLAITPAQSLDEAAEKAVQAVNKM
jgi:succinyl-CoA synthetase beta subunit